MLTTLMLAILLNDFVVLHVLLEHFASDQSLIQIHVLLNHDILFFCLYSNVVKRLSFSTNER